MIKLINYSVVFKPLKLSEIIYCFVIFGRDGAHFSPAHSVISVIGSAEYLSFADSLYLSGNFSSPIQNR